MYTSRYTLFFVRLLLQLNDKTSMEALAKRVRKRAADFYQHTKVWTEVGRAYMKVRIFPRLAASNAVYAAQVASR